MKLHLTFLIFLLSLFSLFAQNKKCCDTYVYEGFILTDQGKKLDINLNFLLLLDSTLVGSYHYSPRSGSLKISGKLKPDMSFYLVERDALDSLTGLFQGKLNDDLKFASGKWTNAKTKKEFDFELNHVEGKSYWDYIKKNRALYEYTDIKKAIRNKKKALSIDVASQSLSELPDKLKNLDGILSINLLGNNFENFPVVLSELETLTEISLSSNRLTYVGPEIGKLKNLRILIMNFNQLKQLPKEIGQLTELLYLEVGRNELAALPDEIKNLTKLQELHIENNRLSDSEKQKIKDLLPNCIIHF
ncbi:MAG: leucine-rich repeat domain-containing protein [Flavobacterium sp.]